jgi:hypothetical protein
MSRMWKTWVKRLPYSQTFILVCLLVFYFAVGVREWDRLLLIFLFLELMTLQGAWVGQRMEKAADKSSR